MEGCASVYAGTMYQPSFLFVYARTLQSHLRFRMMSVMEPLAEGESGATLQDVLALLEACESSSERSVSSLPPFPRRDESHSYYRTRNELQRLRQDAVTLEYRLSELKHNQAPIYEQWLAKIKALSAVEAKQRIEIVQSEFKRRNESERTNCQLKALLAKYVQMIHVMESAFDIITDAVMPKLLLLSFWLLKLTPLFRYRTLRWYSTPRAS